MKKNLHINNNFKKTYLFPVLASVIMGAAAFGVYKLFELIFKQFVGSEYFVNLFSAMVAVAVAAPVYFIVLIKSGGATQEDIRRFPKGAGIVSILKKCKIL